MSSANLYGQVVTAADCERAIVASLDLWLDGALGEIERLEGYDPNAIERPRDIVTSSEFEKLPEIQIPCILVLNAGLAERPSRRVEGRYDAKWLIGVAPIVSDLDVATTRTLAMAYAAAVRVAITQHKMLKSAEWPAGFATGGLIWRDETYQDLPFEESRSLMAARVIFEVGVEGVVTEQAGPRTPPTDPTVSPPDWPEAVSVTDTAHPITLTGSLT